MFAAMWVAVAIPLSRSLVEVVVVYYVAAAAATVDFEESSGRRIELVGTIAGQVG